MNPEPTPYDDVIKRIEVLERSVRELHEILRKMDIVYGPVKIRPKLYTIDPRKKDPK